MTDEQHKPLVPAKAGTQGQRVPSWIPACAGMSGECAPLRMMLGSSTTRRQVLAGTLGAVSLLVVRPARATPGTMAAAIRDVTGEAAVKPGKVKLEVPPLVENGNTVPLVVTVDNPMTEADHVKAIYLFNEKNPQPNIANFHLGPRAGVAKVSTRIRLADSQKVTAIAQLSDGSFWSDEVEVIVTLAACVEIL
jgi:sulfur-oxidizing protein SoxY